MIFGYLFTSAFYVQGTTYHQFLSFDGNHHRDGMRGQVLKPSGDSCSSDITRQRAVFLRECECLQ